MSHDVQENARKYAEELQFRRDVLALHSKFDAVMLELAAIKEEVIAARQAATAAKEEVLAFRRADMNQILGR